MKNLTFSINFALMSTHMNRVIFGKNRCGVEMKYECLVVEKFSFVNMVEMREIWSRGELFYTQQTASFNLAPPSPGLSLI